MSKNETSNAMEFLIIDRRGEPGAVLSYEVYLVPAGGSHRNWSAKYIGQTATLWGARLQIRNERRRLRKFGAPTVVHREEM